jgi:RNA polymerase sigma-70 factor (ECF subfamily)
MSGLMPGDRPQVVVSLARYRVAPNRLLGLLRGCAVKDRRAFTRLYDALSPTVTAAVRDIVTDRVRADVVTSEAFVEAWHSAQTHTARGTDVAAWNEDLAVRRAGGTPAGEVPEQRTRADGPTLAQLLQRTPARRYP